MNASDIKPGLKLRRWRNGEPTDLSVQVIRIYNDANHPHPSSRMRAFCRAYEGKKQVDQWEWPLVEVANAIQSGRYHVEE